MSAASPHRGASAQLHHELDQRQRFLADVDRQVTETKGAHARLTYLKAGYRNDTKNDRFVPSSLYKIHNP
jgi:hypothetical protein